MVKLSLKQKSLLVLALIVVASAAVYLTTRPSQTKTNGTTQPAANQTQQPQTQPTETVPRSSTSDTLPTIEPEKDVIVENDHYKIKKTGNDYVITLYAIINKPEQYDEYVSQLKAYKAEALDYLTKNNINTGSNPVIYEPSEAQNI